MRATSSQIREKGFHSGRDEEFDAFVLDEAAEDKVCVVWLAPMRVNARRLAGRLPTRATYPCPSQLLDDLEPTMAAGGNVVEFHSVDFFPERWFDIVLVLRTETRELFDRLTAR